MHMKRASDILVKIMQVFSKWYPWIHRAHSVSPIGTRAGRKEWRGKGYI